MSRHVALIVGGTGMLGHKLAQVLGAAEDIELHVAGRTRAPAAFQSPRATYHDGITLTVDLADIGRLLDELRPDVVVNAAGAIKHRDLSSSVADTLWLNGVFPHALSARNPNPDGRVIQVSTDCVFRGDRGLYKESDSPDATDIYGLSKVAGELHYARNLTLRTSIIGPEVANHLGLMGWFLRQPKDAVIKGFRHAIFSGVPTVSLSATILDIIRNHPTLCGLYHVAADPIDKLDLLQRLNAALELGRVITPSDDLRIDRSLDDTRFRVATGTKRPGWDALVAELAADFRSLPYAAA